MKSSRFLLVVAALSCLLVRGATPARAYYPPFQITATSNGGTGVTLTVNDPEKGTVSKTYPDFKGVLFYANNHSIVMWESQTVFPGTNDVAYNANYAIYDPFKKTFQVETQGPFLQTGQMKAGDGVVAFVPWVDPNKFFEEFRYSTYDPNKGAWQNRSWVPGSIYNETYSLYTTTKEGVVICKYRWKGPPFFSEQYEVDADIYNPWAGKWSSEMGTTGAPEVVYNDAFPVTAEINNATVYFSWYPMPEVTLSDLRGYDASKGEWYKGKTKLAPYFITQPFYGAVPLWVWFTDMSIGANKWSWDFGDGATSSNPSPYHTYTVPGNYPVTQKTWGLGTQLRATTIYAGVLENPLGWQMAYSSMADKDALGLLRQYRDEVLSQDPRGKFYKDRLYENSEAALTVLIDNPELLAQARNVIDVNMGAVIQVLQGHEGTIYDPEAVLDFLQSFEEYAPPQLKALINVVQKEMRQSQQQDEAFLGFRLGAKGRGRSR